MENEYVSLAVRIAVDTRWAFCDDRTAATEPARQAFNKKFEVLVDPLGELAPEEREKRACNLRSAYFSKLALQRARKRNTEEAVTE